MTIARQRAGIPAGGQFCASSAARATVELAPAGIPECHTVSYETFDALPEPAKQALRHWSHENSAEEQGSWQREQNVRYEIETVPMSEIQARIMATNTSMIEDFGDFGRYHTWFIGGGDVPDHGESRWPVIEAEATFAPEAEYLDDGWHRFHSYVRAGDQIVDVLRVLPR